MENASRAIIMVGGVFLAMLLLGLLAFAWNQYAEYQNSQDSITDVENIAKFNEQFSNYDRDDVQGYELITLSNKVADYNNRYASSVAASEGATGTGTYSEISLYIYMYDQSGDKSESIKNVNLLTKIENKPYLFTGKKGEVYEQSLNYTLTKNVFSDIYGVATAIEDVFGDASSATRIAKAIDKIFYYYSNGDPVSQDNVNYLMQHNNMTESDVKKYGLQNYNSCIYTNGKKLEETDADKLYATTDQSKDCLYNKAMTYYEYMMFKTLLFKCTDVSYDQETQRVRSMTFECIGKFAS